MSWGRGEYSVYGPALSRSAISSLLRSCALICPDPKRDSRPLLFLRHVRVKTMEHSHSDSYRSGAAFALDSEDGSTTESLAGAAVSLEEGMNSLCLGIKTREPEDFSVEPLVLPPDRVIDTVHCSEPVLWRVSIMR